MMSLLYKYEKITMEYQVDFSRLVIKAFLRLVSDDLAEVPKR